MTTQEEPRQQFTTSITEGLERPSSLENESEGWGTSIAKRSKVCIV
jgi:hypothetical protein